MISPDIFETYNEKGATESSSFTKGLQYVSRISARGVLRIVDRLSLEGQGIPVQNIPVGGGGADELLDMFEKFRQGFRLLSKIQTYSDEEINPAKFLSVVGTSNEDTAVKLLSTVFPEKKLTSPNDQYGLSVALAFTHTLLKLVQANNVNFYHLGIVPTNDNPRLISQHSYWRMNLSQENIWDAMGEISTTVKMAVYQRGYTENVYSLYKAAHFLGAAASLRMIA